MYSIKQSLFGHETRAHGLGLLVDSDPPPHLAAHQKPLCCDIPGIYRNFREQKKLKLNGWKLGPY